MTFVRRVGLVARSDGKRFWRSFRRVYQLPWITFALLAVVLLGALALRLPAIDRGTQIGFSELYVDEYKILSNTKRVLEGAPLLAHWPYALYRWLQPQFGAAMVATIPALTEAKGELPRPGEMAYVLVKIDTRWSMGLLRYNALFFGLALIVVIFGLTRQVAGDYAAVGAAALAAASPVLVAYSRTLYYDLPMTFWFWVTVGVLAWAARYRSIAGIYVTAALLAWTVTTKQNAITLAPLWVFVAVYVVALKEDIAWYRALVSRHIILAGVLGIVIFLINYPTLLDPESLKQLGFLTGKEHLAVGDAAPRERLWELWLTKYWPGQAHPAVLGILVIGLILLPIFSRDRLTALLIVAATLLYYGIAGGMAHLNLRTITPLIPGLCIGVAGWWLLAERYFSTRRATAAAGLLTACLLVPLLSNSIRQTMLIMLPNTAEQAARWVEQNAAPMSKVAQETYTLRLVDAPNVTFERYAAIRDIAAFDVDALGSVGTKPPEAYRADGFDYLMLHQKNIDHVQRNLSMGKEMTDYDVRAPSIGKTQRYGGVPLSQVMENYAAIDREFETVATFSSNPPSNVDFIDTTYPWWTLGSLIHPGLFDLWRNFDRYSLGETVKVYRVR